MSDTVWSMGIAGYASVCVQLYCILPFTTCFGLHDHLQVGRIFTFVCLKDSASLLFFFLLSFSRGHTLHVFHLCFVLVLFPFVIFVLSLRLCLSACSFFVVHEQNTTGKHSEL
jgi:hypothetical protein